MFVTILFFAFVSAFVAIVALGHVLLLTAIWPGLLGKPSGPHRDTALAGPDMAAQQIQPSN